MHRHPVFLSLLLAVIGLAANVSAQTYSWNLATGTNSWGTPGNWLGGSAPSSSATNVLLFTGTTSYGSSNDCAGSFWLNQLIVSNGSAVSVVGGPLTFITSSADGALPSLWQRSTGTLAILNSLVLSNNLSVQGTGNGQVNLSGSISGAGAVIKSNSATVLLSSANSYSGGTVVALGTLRSSLAATAGPDNTPFGTGNLVLGGGVTLALAPSGSGSDVALVGAIDSGARFRYGSSGNGLRNILSLARGTQNSLTFTVGSGSGTVLERTGRGLFFLAPTSLAALGVTEKFIIHGTAPAVNNGMVSPTILAEVDGVRDFLTYGVNGFTQAVYTTHATTFTPDGTEIANLTSSLTINAGTLTALRLGANVHTVTLSGTLNNTSGGIIGQATAYPTNLITGGTLAFGSTEAVVAHATYMRLDSTLTGSGGLTVFGAGDIVLGGNNSGLSGGMIFNAGRVFWRHLNALGPNLGTVTLGSSVPALTLEGLSGSQTFQQTLVASSGSGLANRTATTGLTFLMNRTTLPTAGTFRLNQDDQNTYAITLNGDYGTLTGNLLFEINAFATKGKLIGQTTLTGKLPTGAAERSITVVGAAGNGTGSVILPGLVIGELVLDANAKFTVNPRAYINGTGTAWTGGVAQVNLITETVAGRGLTVNGATLGGSIGTLILSGTVHNAFSGPTTVNSGELQLVKTAGINAIGAGGLFLNGGTVRWRAANQIDNAALVTINSGTVNLNGFAETIGGLAGNGGLITNGVSGTVTLTLTGTTATVFSGQIVAGTGDIALTKTGAGAQSLEGNNSYGGLTTVKAGTLLINGSLNAAANGVVVEHDATLGGTGTINRAVSIQDGGRLAPGSSPGRLTVDSLSLSATATSVFEVASLSLYDQVVVNNALNLAGVLEVHFTSNFAAQVSFDLFDSNTRIGTFSQLIAVGGSYQNSDLSFDPTTGVLTVIPEPSALALVAGGLLWLLLVRGGRCAASPSPRPTKSSCRP